MISKHLQDKLALLPDSPGCYIMKDENQEILYVGKAKVLKNRVRSYFHGTHNGKTARLVSHIADFEFIETQSEKESFLLEINLIKKHRPPYNIMLMDDSSYPYIVMTHDKNFAVRKTRSVTNKKDEYFGPYPSSTAASEIVRLINTYWPIRKCKHIPKQPCLYYHMHQCLAPCVQEVDAQEMDQYRNEIRQFLKGDGSLILKELEAKMQEASEQLAFERAQEIKEMIEAVHHVLDKQIIDFKDRKDRDVFGYYEANGYISIQGFFIRDGKLLARNFTVSPIYEDTMDAFLSFILQYYQKNLIPKEILLPEGTPLEGLEDSLQTKIFIPQRGDKKKLVDLVMKNAQTAHEQKFEMVFRKEKDLDLANQMLERIFHAPIHRIECFDNSHISGSYNVSGLVVFKDGKPDKSSYRHYKLDGYRSDIDSMKEVLYRRYFRLLKEGKSMPDLLIVDGGAQQIAAAKEIREMLELDLRIVGLVKDDKHTTRTLMNDAFEEIPLERESSLFFLLTRIQDEVHRFAISYHRKLRDKGMTKSMLDDIEGIGPSRKKKLLNHFKSMKRIRSASIEELESLLPKEVAQSLYDRCHQKDML